ncbi:MAG TPA: M28 family metallopeptidase [Candidatus Limnocylindria bacterium]|nr:M28 family metallopeptidase [Candidatus Limnocylindria bacterium]
MIGFALALALACAGSARPAAAEPTRITGFRLSDTSEQLAREARAAAAIHRDTLRRHLRILTEEPHVAGTPQDRATAEYVRQRLAAYGWDARIETIPVYLNYPREHRLELIEPTQATLAVRERGLLGDKDAFDVAAFDGFHGYGAAGDVTAQVVYANYGDVDDFKKLTDLGVDVRNKIVLVRYGKIFRGLKVRNAEKVHAAGVIIYSDPLDDGYGKGDPYPRGPARPDDGIQRGSVQYLSEGPGDPTTPGWPSTEKGKRLRASDVRGIPRIPSLPIAWSEAARILEALEGPAAPSGWQGGLPFSYHVGPGPAKVRLKTDHDYAVRPIWNVIATLKGRERPNEWVMCGNHRDAWTYGAVDPNSGTIAMMEMARTIGGLLESGWRPRRTLVLCSWDGEEYGLLGSTEYCEGNAAALRAKAVAYLNVDAAVSGKDFRVNGTHALRDVLVQAMGEVQNPEKRASVFDAWRDKAWSEARAEWAHRNRERRWRGETERPFFMNVSPLGSGSDYTAFVDHLGVPALDLRFEGLHGSYHSMYDDFEYLDRVVDPGYAYHLAMTDLWTRVALRLAEAELLPLRYSNSAQYVLDELQAIEERLDDARAGVDSTQKLAADFAPIRAAGERLLAAARAFEDRCDRALEGEPWPGGSATAANAKLIAIERAFIGPGLPGRTWFRHEIYAPGLNTGYAPVPLPRLGQPLLDRDGDALRAGIGPVREVLLRAAALLEGER